MQATRADHDLVMFLNQGRCRRNGECSHCWVIERQRAQEAERQRMDRHSLYGAVIVVLMLAGAGALGWLS